MKKWFLILSILIMATMGKYSMALSNLLIPLPAAKVELDPHLMQDAWSMHLVMQIHRGLLQLTSDGAVMNDLADTVKVLAKGTVYRIKLKQTIFSNGERLTADHVVESFRRIFVSGASISGDLLTIEGAKELLNKQPIKKKFGVVKISDDVVEFHLKQPNSIFKIILATIDCAILYFGKTKDSTNFSVDPRIGLGSYRIAVESKKSIRLDITASAKTLFPKAPDHITYVLDVINAPASSEGYVLDHYSIPIENAQQLLKKGWKKVVTDASRERFLMLNPSRIDLDRRRLIAGQIDPVVLATSVGNTNLLPAFGLIPYGIPGYRQAPIQNKIKSKRVNPLILQLDYPETWGDGELISKNIQSQLNPSAITIQLKKVSFANWMEKKKTGEYDLLLNARGLDYPDAYAILGYFRSGVHGNYLDGKNRKIDDLLDESLNYPDISDRLRIYAQIEEEILSRATVVPLLFGATNSGLWPPSIDRVPPHPLGFHYLRIDQVEMR